MTRKIALVAIVAMLATGTSVALAVGAGSHAETDATMAQETTTAMGEAAQNETANVTFQNQSTNGTVVVVERVFLPEGGFVVIHEAQNATADNETETPAMDENETQQYVAGEVLGNSTHLASGVHENVTIVLNQSINESQVLIAMTHRDTNENRMYDFPEADGPYTEDGEAVTDWAFVTVEEGANQTAANETTTEEM